MGIKQCHVNELNGKKFIVPKYQRGYRWEKMQVEAFLNDVWEIQKAGNNQEYCIQPLIVKQSNDGKYEVVDGQQRLTTIYIFYKYTQAQISDEYQPIFSLEYETRPESGFFLENMHIDASRNNQKKDDNIDFFHMIEAYQAIEDWISHEIEKDGNLLKRNVLTDMDNCLGKKVFFLWYEIDPKDDAEAIKIFNDINMGKISLTNAELIKALLLSKDIFQSEMDSLKEDDRQSEMKKLLFEREQLQLEIALSWDQMEQVLQEDRFWFFLSSENGTGTRIDLLFQILAEQWNQQFNFGIPVNDERFSYLVFDRYLHRNNQLVENVKEIWSQTRKLFSDFQEWYSQLGIYHIIGYLSHKEKGTSLSRIWRQSKCLKKNEFEQKLIQMACDKLFKYTALNSFKIEELASLVKGSHDELIKKVLLLFNIATLSVHQEYRFPFDLYCKKINWDIEHIHATNDFEGEPDDSLGNLTLLNADINRAYKDAPFSYKREFIIKKDSSGTFIPLCTRNIFYKTYTEKPWNFDQWDDTDKKQYLQAMSKILTAYQERSELA